MGKKDRALLRQISQQLFGIFQQQLGAQRGLLDFLKQRLSFVFDPEFTGFLPGEEAALRTQAFEETTGRFDVARQQIQSRAAILGGRQLPGGATIALLGGVEAAEAEALAGAQRQISIEGGQRRLASIFNASSILQGNAALLNPAAISGQAVGGAAALAQRGQGGGLLNSLIGAGAAIGSSAILACWVAYTLYDSYTAHYIQTHLYQHPQFAATYQREGREWAAMIHQSFLAHIMLRQMFDTLRE
jgi:hypothetical protein